MSDNLISIIKDRSCDIPEVLAERYLIKKYNFAIGNLAIIDVKGFLDFIKKEYKTKDAVVFDFGSKRSSQYIEALDDSFLIFISQYSDTGSVEIYGKDMQITANVHNNLKDFLNSEDDIQVHMHNYTLEGKLSYKEIILEKDKLGKFSKKYYPDWFCRFYIDKNCNQELIDTIKGDNVEVILVDSKDSFHGMFWRFWAAADPDVDIFMSRDTDSRLSDREYY